MTLADLSVKRPIFITCIVILMLALGLLSLSKLAVDLFPNISFPVVTITTVYPGAGPEEVETLVSKVLEEELSTVPGVKTLSSINRDSVSTVIAEFALETDIKYAEQQVRDRASSARRKLPTDSKEPVIRRIDPADQPIMVVGVTADLTPAELYELADQIIKTKIEQISHVGLVEVLGGRKREIRVELDRDKLKSYEISATGVVNRISAAGVNIPAGKVERGNLETVFRTLGEFRNLKEIGNTIVSFFGNDVPVKVSDVGRVADALEDEKSRAFVNGKPAVFLNVFRQSGANTVAVADAVKARVAKLQTEMATTPGKPQLQVLRDGAKPIRANLDDVKESIFLGIILTIVVVYFFLGSARSTLITGLALPNSLIGAFLLMAWAGFSINVMKLLALSLSVGLLIDDAIVVRENIFRHIEMGKSPREASLVGTKEVTLAVIATTLAVIAVFGPIGFLQGVVGQFFKEFGLTICFAMAISLFDALTIAPMLSTYFAASTHEKKTGYHGIWGNTMGRVLGGFDWFQSKLEDGYEHAIRFTLKRPILIIMGAVAIFAGSIYSLKFVPKTFLSPQDMGEFMISLEMPAGTPMDEMNEMAMKVDAELATQREIVSRVLSVGSRDGESNFATILINMIPAKERTLNTSQFKDKMREALKKFKTANPIVKDIDMVAGGQRPFQLNIIGNDIKQLEAFAQKAFDRLKDHPGLKDAEISFKTGKPEFQVKIDNARAEKLGVSTALVGGELRTLVEGSVPAVFRENGLEYDIRVRLKEEQRNLAEGFNRSYVPNINFSLVRLSDISTRVETRGPANINRTDRGRYIQIGADIAAGGPGMGGVMADINEMFSKEMPLPEGMRYRFVGQAENFKELGQNMAVAMLLGILFVYLVLASLYESFVTPITIMVVLPLAACGAFYALLITRHSLDLFSMIGCILLLGVATKNSILLVDYIQQQIEKGATRADAIIQAGRTRLRPILMTTIALIAGMLPVAIGLNEASRQRTSMGIAIIGGLISSTLLTLLVVPATFSYIDRFRIWSGNLMSRLFNPSAKRKVKSTTLSFWAGFLLLLSGLSGVLTPIHAQASSYMGVGLGIGKRAAETIGTGTYYSQETGLSLPLFGVQAGMRWGSLGLRLDVDHVVFPRVTTFTHGVQKVTHRVREQVAEVFFGPRYWMAPFSVSLSPGLGYSNQGNWMNWIQATGTFHWAGFFAEPRFQLQLNAPDFKSAWMTALWLGMDWE